MLDGEVSELMVLYAARRDALDHPDPLYGESLFRCLDEVWREGWAEPWMADTMAEDLDRLSVRDFKRS